MSVIPQSFNQGTGFVGSVSTGGTIPSEIDDLIVTNSLTSLGTTTLEGATVINSTLDVAGDVTVNNVTVNGFLTAPNLAIEAVNKNDNLPFPVLFYDAATKKVCIGDPATLSSFTYNPNTRQLILEKLLVNGESVLANNITATSLTVRMNSLQTAVTGNNYAIMLYDFANPARSVAVDSSNFYYDKTTGSLHVGATTVISGISVDSGLLQGQFV